MPVRQLCHGASALSPSTPTVPVAHGEHAVLTHSLTRYIPPVACSWHTTLYLSTWMGLAFRVPFPQPTPCCRSAGPHKVTSSPISSTSKHQLLRVRLIAHPRPLFSCIPITLDALAHPQPAARVGSRSTARQARIAIFAAAAPLASKMHQCPSPDSLKSQRSSGSNLSFLADRS